MEKTEMNINRKAFFDAIRASVHKGSMSEEQVASYEAILNAAAAYPVTDPCHLSYILATTRGEVGTGFQPVREIGRGKGKRYGIPDPVTGEVYYGRGFTQLTWADNYRKMGKRIGMPLYEEPDLALRPEIAAKVMVIGMMEGIFTGKKLADYINAKATNYREARRIINIMDRADEFAGFARTYEAAIRAALVKEDKVGEIKDASGTISIIKPAPAPSPAPDASPPSSTSPPAPETKPRVSATQVIIGTIAAALGAIFAWVFAGGSQ